MLILLGIFYTVLTGILTFPLVFRINYAMPGFPGTDEPSLWYYWWLHYAQMHKISSKFSNLIAYPFGMDLSIIEKIFPLGILEKKILIYLSNGILAYNLEILATFVLSGLFTYLLVRHITNNRLAAIFSGIIYSFCPYHFARAWQHSTLAQIQWFPLLLLSLIRLREAKKIKMSFLAVAIIIVIFSIDLFYGYFSLIILAIFTIFNLVIKQAHKKRIVINIILNSLVLSLVILILLLPMLLYVFSGSNNFIGAWSARTRPFEDLFMQSARPLSYFLPAAFHPLFGNFTDRLVGSTLYGRSYTEHTLYLGWVPMILAFVAFRIWRKRRKEVKIGTVPFGDSPYFREDFYIGFFVFLAIAAWILSQPPWWDILGFKIYMPSFFIYKILPMFRAYCRFGIVVMLAVAVLAGFGLKFILERFKTRKSKIAIAVLFWGLVLFEFWNWPPYRVIDLSRVPAVYYWLKALPGDFAIAEYPLDTEGPNEKYKFFQTEHGKKIINGTIPSTYANKITQTITKLSKPHTAGVLRWMGVRYVLVHAEDYKNTGLMEWIGELNKIPKNPGLKFIKKFSAQACPEENIMCIQETGPIDVYEVVASAVKPKIE